MRRDLIQIVCCPADRARLVLEAVREDDGEVVEGTLTCSECGFVYPIEDGIPNLLPPEYHVEPARVAEPPAAPGRADEEE